MTTIAETASMTGPEIVSLSRKTHPLRMVRAIQSRSHSVASAKGIYFYTPEGSALSTSTASSCPSTSDTATRASFRPSAIKPPLSPMPILSWQPSRARALGQARRNLSRRYRYFLLHQRRSRSHETPSSSLALYRTPQVIARYRSYHGATAGAMSLTGDPRRWAVDLAFQRGARA